MHPHKSFTSRAKAGGALLIASAIGCLCSSPAARAAIALQDGSTAIHTPNSANISQPFTVTPGAGVLVVELIGKGGTINSQPASLNWNGGQTILLAVTTNNINSTYRDVSIYYLYNPTPGSGNITGTFLNGEANNNLVAYTLSGLDVSKPPLTGLANNSGATTINFNVAGVPANAWAAVNGVLSANGDTVAITDNAGGTVQTSTDNANLGTVAMGYISTLAPGLDNFTLTASANNKMVLVAAIFTPAGPASIGQNPQPQVLYAGETATFSATAGGSAPLTYHWQKNGVNLVNGGNISGATNATLRITGISAGDAANYAMQASNPGGSATSVAASLTVLPLTEPYATAVVADSPVALYEFNDPGDPATNASAFDTVGGFVGTYGAGVENGNPIAGALTGPDSAEGFPGFAPGHAAAGFTYGFPTSQVTVPAFNLGASGTNVTITAWVNPNGTENPANGIVFCRAGTTVAGLCYTADTDAGGNYTLGYNWNNDAFTYGWNSELTAPQNQWSFVALVVTPTNATIHLMNTNGVASSTFTHNHVAQAFDGITLVGDDSFDAGAGTRVFNGAIADVAIFRTALSKTQLLGLFSAASGVANFPPYIATQPASLGVYPGMAAQFAAPSGGSDPLAYQWQAGVSGSGVFTNLLDGGPITGSATPQLNYASVPATGAADLCLVISNAYGAVTSAVVTLAILPTSPAEAITMSVQEAIGQDWDTGTAWSDGNPASTSAFEFPGSTYEVLAGARLRSPAGTVNAIFPGQILTIDGDGNFVNAPAAGAAVGELRFKEPSSGSSVTFSNLVMNGGQIDLGNDGLVILDGLINILTNTPMYIDSGGTANRQLRIDGQITGTGSIEWSSFDTTLTGALIIDGPNNTFTGAWQVDQGLLLATAPNALGTNTITVGTNGVLFTTYDLVNTNGSLLLNGRMLLTQNDVFANVSINGTALTPGYYTFNQLANLYPTNFPATWTGAAGSTTAYVGSGSINVGNVTPPPPPAVTLHVQLVGANVVLTWSQGALLQAASVAGPWTTNTATSPYTNTPATPHQFYRVRVQ